MMEKKSTRHGKNLNVEKAVLATVITLAVILGRGFVHAEERAVKIVSPAHGAEIVSPVKICMEVAGLTLEPANDKVNEGMGHHHILFSSLPADLNKPIGKNEAVHLGKGLPCHTVELPPGKHVIRALFAYGNHVPYNPLITDKILITVK